MFQAFQSVKVSDKDDARFGEAGHVVGQAADVVSVKMDVDGAAVEFHPGQLLGL